MKRCKNCNSIIADPDPETTYPVIFCPWPDCQSSDLETIGDELPFEETPDEYLDRLIQEAAPAWEGVDPDEFMNMVRGRELEPGNVCNSCGNDPGEPHICPAHDNGEWNDWNCTCNCCPDCMAAGKCGAL